MSTRPINPGVPSELTSAVGNPFQQRYCYPGAGPTPARLEHFVVSQDVLPDMNPSEVPSSPLTVTPPVGAPLPLVPYLLLMFQGYIEGNLVGGIELKSIPKTFYYTFITNNHKIILRTS